jgi:hypothetical protein
MPAMKKPVSRPVPASELRTRPAGSPLGEAEAHREALAQLRARLLKMIIANDQSRKKPPASKPR